MKSSKLLLVALSFFTAITILFQCKVEKPTLTDSDAPYYFPDIQLPADTTKNVFADFMWQMFISLSQPENGGNIPASNDYRTLWEPFATSHKLFGSGKEKHYTNMDDLKNEKSLVIPNYIQASDSGDFHHNSPLIDLDHQYTWAGLRYNEVFTNYVLKYKLNDQASVKEAFHKGSGKSGEVIQWLPDTHSYPDLEGKVKVAKFEFPDYSIMLKPGWKILTARDNTADFFLARPKPEFIYDNNNYNNLKKSLAERQLVDTTNCQLTSNITLLDSYNRDIYNETPPGTQVDTFKAGGAEAGLVAYHLVVKMPNHPFWIWATFEHVKNGPLESEPHTYNQDWTFFDDANNTKRHNAWPKLTSGVKDSIGALNPDPTKPDSLYKFQWFDPNVENQLPTQVTRVDPIDPIVESINAEYQKKYANTIWQNYKLIDVQWVRYEGDTPKTYPPYIANTALETYIQATSSCMGCHALVADVNKDKGTDSTKYLLTSPTGYHIVIPMLESNGKDSILVGDFSFGFGELFGKDITSNQVDLDSLPVRIPVACKENE
ncbi:MAG: hypothetical protein ACI8VT_002801 [Saprospiraceae bacterium]|jgi:hypothetical protein